MIITANQIKVNGIKVIINCLKEWDICTVSHRGKAAFVCVDMQTYKQFKEWQLDQNLAECEKDINFS